MVAQAHKGRTKEKITMLTYIEAAAAERQLVVPGTSLASMEQVMANTKAARWARTSNRVITKGRGMMRARLQRARLHLRLERSITNYDIATQALVLGVRKMRGCEDAWGHLPFSKHYRTSVLFLLCS